MAQRIDVGLRDRLQALAIAQNAVARRDQLDTLGLPRHVTENMLDSGRWRAHGPLVIVMHNGPLSHRQQLWVVVRNVTHLVALAGRTGATEFGLSGWQPDCIEVLVPRGGKVPSIGGIDLKVHESRRFSEADLHAGRALPTVRFERSLVDAASWSQRPRTACGILCAGVQQRLTTAARLVDVLAVAGKVQHRKLLFAALTDIDGGAQAMSEIDFLRFCRRNGLPRPELQLVRFDRQGRRRYLDATFKTRDGRSVRVEIDGALHLVVRTYWDDMFRGNELVFGREPVLRFPSFVVHANDPAALGQLRRALGLSERRPPLTG